MLRLKTLLVTAGLTTQQAAAAAGISRSALSQIVNHDHWPCVTPRQQVEGALRNLLQGRGIDAAGCFEVAPDRVSDPTPNPPERKEGVDMLLRKQRLSPAARTHFNLGRDPFDEDPQHPDDVFLTPRLREVLADMESAVLNGRFIAVSGESGSGKSTLRELLEERLKTRAVKIIKPYVLGMEDNDRAGKTLRVAHIGEAIIRTLDPTARIKSSSEARHHQTHQLLKSAVCPCGLVIEEAHALPISTLKHFKRLRELKDGLKQLLGVLLIGQQELEDKIGINKQEVREVMQRCELVRLDPLGRHLPDYLAHRFSRQGGQPASAVFDDSAIPAMQELLTDRRAAKRIQDGQLLTRSEEQSLLYPLAVGNLAVAAMNLAATLGMARVNGDLVRKVVA